MNRKSLAPFAIFVLLALNAAACAPRGGDPAELIAPAEELVWPAPPETPRIKFLYAFREAGDLGIKKPFLEQLWSAIAGGDENQRMLKPYAVAAEGQRIVVTDPGMRAIHLFDVKAGTYRRITRAKGQFLRSPVGAALGPKRIFVADSVLGKVFALDAEGDVVATLKGLKRPTGLAYDHASGRLYVAETTEHRISVFDDAGKRLFAFGGRGTGRIQFNYPSHLFLKNGRLYVNDTMNFRLQTFDLEGHLLSSFGRHGDGSGNFSQPKGVGVDAEGHIYVADAAFDRVQIFDPRGRYLLGFGGQGDKLGNFWLPAGVFIAGDRIYVADSYNRRVQVFQFLGGE